MKIKMNNGAILGVTSVEIRAERSPTGKVLYKSSAVLKNGFELLLVREEFEIIFNEKDFYSQGDQHGRKDHYPSERRAAHSGQ